MTKYAHVQSKSLAHKVHNLGIVNDCRRWSQSTSRHVQAWTKV